MKNKMLEPELRVDKLLRNIYELANLPYGIKSRFKDLVEKMNSEKLSNEQKYFVDTVDLYTKRKPLAALSIIQKWNNSYLNDRDRFGYSNLLKLTAIEKNLDDLKLCWYSKYLEGLIYIDLKQYDKGYDCFHNLLYTDKLREEEEEEFFNEVLFRSAICQFALKNYLMVVEPLFKCFHKFKTIMIKKITNGSNPNGIDTNEFDDQIIDYEIARILLSALAIYCEQYDTANSLFKDTLYADEEPLFPFSYYYNYAINSLKILSQVPAVSKILKLAQKALEFEYIKGLISKKKLGIGNKKMAKIYHYIDEKRMKIQIATEINMMTI